MSKPIPTEAWQELAAEALSGLAAWRLEHPQATLAEIEVETDQRLAVLRARMVQDVAQASERAQMGPAVARPTCPQCGCELRKKGAHQRRLTTRHEQTIALTRERMSCPQCGAGFFPPG
jgi:uncharacterized protein with PIN domain